MLWTTALRCPIAEFYQEVLGVKLTVDNVNLIITVFIT
jgi:hypothetical protein